VIAKWKQLWHGGWSDRTLADIGKKHKLSSHGMIDVSFVTGKMRQVAVQQDNYIWNVHIIVKTGKPKYAYYEMAYWPNLLHCKFYVIHNVHVLTINIWSNEALWDTPFMTYIDCFMFRHGDATLRKSLKQRYISQHANIFSASPYMNDQDIKMLKYVKFITLLNNSIWH
jgi:hypothetical protein